MRKGQKVSPENKKKLRQASLRNWQDPEFRARALAAHPRPKHTPETRAKMGVSRRGTTITDEHKQKLRVAAKRLWESEDYRQRVRERLNDPDVKARANSPTKSAKVSAAKRQYWASLSPAKKRERMRSFMQAGHEKVIRRTPPTKIETAVAAVLDILGIPYEQQKSIGDYFIDFYLPDYCVALECDGDYWHRLKKVKEHDVVRDAWLAEQGCTVIRLSETEINSDAEQAVRRALLCA